ncbi:MAG: prenyltransferase/squalene oxidase repeat-containing protein, partial [Planctomycetota bacterium]
MTKKSSSKIKKACPEREGRAEHVSSRRAAPAPAPKKAPEVELEDEGMPPSADDAAAEMLDSAVKNTPWWALSLAFHGCVLASLPLIVFSQQLLAGQPDRPVIIQVNRPPKNVIKEITPSDLRASRAISGDMSPTPADVPDIKFPVEFVESDKFSDGQDPERDYGMKGSVDGTSAYDGVGDGMGRRNGPGKGPDVTGVGPGGGGGKKFGNGPYSGRYKTYIKRRGTGGSGSAIEHGLYWLARHQHEDGHWSTEGYHANCGGGSKCTGTGLSDFDVGNTGLALLAFLGAGYTPSMRAVYRDPVTQKEISMGDVVRKAAKWLIERQNADGAIGPQVGEMMYNHSIAALALSEAYGLTGAVSYRLPAQKAINFIVTAQNYGLGWRYTPKCGNNDTSVTGWCVMALKSAQLSGIEVPQTSFVGAKAWLERVTDSTGQHGYDKL